MTDPATTRERQPHHTPPEAEWAWHATPGRDVTRWFWHLHEIRLLHLQADTRRDVVRADHTL